MKIVVMIPFGMTRTLTLSINRYLWIVFLVLPLLGNAQKSTTDSLQKVLISLPPAGRSFGSDTTRVGVLCEMGKAVTPDKRTQFFEKANDLANRRNWFQGQMRTYYYLGENYGLLVNYYRGAQCLFKALTIAEKLKDAEMGCKILYVLGNYYNLMNDPKEGLKLHLRAFSQLPPKSPQKAKLLNILGTDYYSLGRLKEAEFYFRKGLVISRQAKLSIIESYCVANLAFLSLDKNNFSEASYYFKIYESILDKFNMSKIDLHIGLTKLYVKEKKYDKAKKEALMLYKMAIKSQSDSELSAAHENMYEFYNNISDSKKALESYQQWNKFKEKVDKDMKNRLLSALKFEYDNENNLIKIHSLDSQLSDKQNELKILLIAILSFILIIIILFWNNKILKGKNLQIEMQKKELYKLKDELNVSNKKLLELNESLEIKIENRTSELKFANEELIRKNNEIQIAFVTGKKQERERVASELHDNLGSTISGLLWQLQGITLDNLTQHEQEIHEALVERVSSAYDEIRHISHHLSPKELDKGFEQALQKLIGDLNRNNKTIFLLKGNLPKNLLSTSKENDMYSICLEIINNIIKHAKASECTIELEVQQASFRVSIKDNGRGFVVGDQQNMGKGLINIKKRVLMLEGDLNIISLPSQGTLITVSIPL